MCHRLIGVDQIKKKKEEQEEEQERWRTMKNEERRTRNDGIDSHLSVVPSANAIDLHSRPERGARGTAFGWVLFVVYKEWLDDNRKIRRRRVRDDKTYGVSGAEGDSSLLELSDVRNRNWTSGEHWTRKKEEKKAHQYLYVVLTIIFSRPRFSPGDKQSNERTNNRQTNIEHSLSNQFSSPSLPSNESDERNRMLGCCVGGAAPTTSNTASNASRSALKNIKDCALGSLGSLP